MTATPEAAVPERRSELDLMRAAVVVGLVFFHTLRVFDSGEYYVKHTPASTVVDLVIGLLVPWAMPLLFVISGIGTWYSLRSYRAGRFVVERLRRLLVPLVVGVVVLCPIPAWLQMRWEDPAYHQSYWSFWRSFFNVSYYPEEFPLVVRPAEGSQFETGHLWYVILLLGFTLLLLPLFLWLRGDAGRRATGWLGAWCERRPWGTLLPALPIAALAAAVDAEVNIAAWNRWGYALFFLFGYLLACDPRFTLALQRVRRTALLGAAVSLALMAVVYGILGSASEDADPLQDMDPGARGFRFVFAVAGWLTVAALIGYLSRGRRRDIAAGGGPEEGRGWRARAQRYANDAVLPFYVLHQPVIVVIGYFVLGWGLPAAAEYFLISLLALAGTLLLYDLLVRRTPVTRVLFGMKARRR